MMDWFWVLHPRPVTCTPYGISFTHQKVRYDYMVHTQAGYPDQKWLREHIDARFFVKYDPEDKSRVYLYEQTPLGLRFVIQAEAKVVIHRAKQEQESWEAEYIQKVDQLKRADRLWVRDTVDEILVDHHMHPRDYSLNAPRLKGIERSRKRRDRKDEFGALQKAESQAVLKEESAAEGDLNIYDLM